MRLKTTASLVRGGDKEERQGSRRAEGCGWTRERKSCRKNNTNKGFRILNEVHVLPLSTDGERANEFSFRKPSLFSSHRMEVLLDFFCLSDCGQSSTFTHGFRPVNGRRFWNLVGFTPISSSSVANCHFVDCYFRSRTGFLGEWTCWSNEVRSRNFYRIL